MNSVNRYSWSLSYGMLAIAIMAVIAVSSVGWCVPSSLLTVLYSDSIFRGFMWMYPACAILLPFCWCRGQDTFFLLGACTLCRVILMAPAAWLLSRQFHPSLPGTLDLRGYYYLMDHSLPWWTKASVLILTVVWYYAVFRFVKRETPVPSWIICCTLMFGILCLEFVSAFYYSGNIAVCTMLWLLVGNGLGLLIREIETNGTKGLKKWILERPVNADHKKG